MSQSPFKRGPAMRGAASINPGVGRSPSGNPQGSGLSIARRELITGAGALGASVLLPGMASAQAEWPSKPVRFVVPFPAGGGADLGARTISVHMGNAFGKPVLVENRAGGDGAVAALEVLRSPSDGHTLFFGTATSMSYVPSIKKAPPYNPIADFTPISNLCIFTFYLMVSPDVPGKTLAELVVHIKANPGKLQYATANSTGILAMGQLVHANKLDMVHVPYKGEGQAVVDLVGGRVPMMFATPAILPQLQKANFRALAVLLPQRTRAYPEVPTMAEAGQPLVNISPWGGLFGPKDLPRALVERINKDFVQVMRRQDVVDQYDKLGLLPLPSTPEQLATVVKEQLAAFGNTMKAIGIPQE